MKDVSGSELHPTERPIWLQLNHPCGVWHSKDKPDLTTASIVSACLKAQCIVLLHQTHKPSNNQAYSHDLPAHQYATSRMTLSSRPAHIITVVYGHVCFICANSPTAQNLDHKAFILSF